MKRLRPAAPSPTTMVAFLALFLALSGTVYAGVKVAKNSIGSGEIKNKSVKGGDLVDDTITGEQVDESTLGVVPRAATAGTATAASSAANAGSAKTADRATTSGTADRATYADRAGTASTADKATSAGTATSASAADRATSAASADKAADATHAANADTVGGHGASDFASASATFPIAAKLAAGEIRTLVSRDGVRLEARCKVNEPTTSGSGTATALQVYAYSSVDGATLQSPLATFDGSSYDNTLGPSTTLAKSLAMQSTANTGVKIERVPTSGIILTSVGGTSIFFGTTGGVRLGIGLNGAVCSINAAVVVAAP